MLPSNYRSTDPLVGRHVTNVDEVRAPRRYSAVWTALMVVAALIATIALLIMVTAR
jgi:hypothetical protein